MTRDREKLCEQVATGKDSKGKPLAEKDLTKVWQLASHMFTYTIYDLALEYRQDQIYVYTTSCDQLVQARDDSHA